jgi:hypothetical protein
MGLAMGCCGSLAKWPSAGGAARFRPPHTAGSGRNRRSESYSGSAPAPPWRPFKVRWSCAKQLPRRNATVFRALALARFFFVPPYAITGPAAAV